MGARYNSIVVRDVPYVYAVSANELEGNDSFRLEKIYHVNPENFVLVKHSKECIVLNKQLDNLAEIKETIEKVMRSKYLPEKLFDKLQTLTDKKTADILLECFLDWKKELQKRELHRQALSVLKSAKGLRISWKVKRNREIIKELFDIGFGLYDKEAKCDFQQGAENAFMYGYLLGVQASKGDKQKGERERLRESEERYRLEQIVDAITQADDSVLQAIQYRDRDMLEDVLRDNLH